MNSSLINKFWVTLINEIQLTRMGYNFGVNELLNGVGYTFGINELLNGVG